MDLGIASHQTRTYTVATPVYEGPLDLLLRLIERAELDITRLALAQVTDQYLEYLHQIENRAAEEVSAFLVIASKLLQIKSEALLPRPPVRQEGEEDPAESLARQLILYKRFKELSAYLGEREINNLKTYLRVAPGPKVEGNLDLTGVTLEDLLLAAESVFANRDDRPPLNSVVAAPKVTIRDKIGLIVRQLKDNGRITFRRLFGRRPSSIDIVVTFLAMLELIKRQMVQVKQESLFGEIEIQTAESWDENESFELEFGE